MAPFALTFAWILVAPWVFPWYTAIAWVALTQVPRNRMTRWLTIVTVLLALWHSGGGQGPAHGSAVTSCGPSTAGWTSPRAAGQAARARSCPAGRTGARGHRPDCAAALAGRRAAGRRACAARASPVRLPARAVLHRLGEVPVQRRRQRSRGLQAAAAGASCWWPTSTPSSRSSTCSASHGRGLVPAAAAPRGSPLAGRARRGAHPAGRLPAAERAVDHAGHLVRGPDRRRHRDPALAADASAGGGSWRAGIVLGTSATVAQVGEALIPAAAIFVLAAAAATGGAPSARPQRCARPAPCPSSPTAPARTCSAAASSSRIRASRRSTAGRRRLSTAPRSSCRPRNAACARLPAQQARGDDWLEFGTYAPVQTLLPNGLCRGPRSTRS